MPKKRSTWAEQDLAMRERGAAAIALALRARIEQEDCEEKFKSFVKAAWHVISPGNPFVDNWHVDCLCDHFEALCRREIRRLIINIPPRSAKSTILAVLGPAWRWLKAPHEKFLCASYGKVLALRDSRACRNLIASPWYQQRWEEKFKLADDQNEKGRFANNSGGFRIIASVEGGVLGEGGSFCLYDDPNDLSKMPSQLYEQTVRDWYSGTASSRFIDPKTDVRLCIQQRAPYGNDLTAYLMELGGWEQLVIPNEFTNKRIVSSIGWSDPRTHVGELMDPKRMGPEEVRILRIEQKDNYQGQYQQAPLSLGGGALKREWFRFWNPAGTNRVDQITGKPIPVRVTLSDGSSVEIEPIELPVAFERVLQSWDMAFKDEAANSKVAGQAWGMVGARTFMLARDTKHRNFPETLQAVRSMSQEFPCPEKLVEDKANGPAVIASLKNEIPGLIAVDPGGNKWARRAAISGYIEAGNVYVPNPDLYPWVWTFIDEMCGEPLDDTDSCTQALRRLYDGAAQAGVPEFRVAPRVGEPQTACHIAPSKETIRPEWRRIIVIVPGRAALWLAETPTGGMRVLHEEDLDKIDAKGVGEAIARITLPIARERAGLPNASIDLLMPKEAFAEVEPIGSYAELVEQSVLGWEPPGDWGLREEARDIIRKAKFRTDMVELEDGALDRLRTLLAFQPPDFKEVSYSRDTALALARSSMAEYTRYMDMVDGQVRGEWPKLKISPQCPRLIGELGSFRRDRLDDAPAFVQALLLGVCAPQRVAQREVVEMPLPQTRVGGGGIRNQRLLARRFAMR